MSHGFELMSSFHRYLQIKDRNAYMKASPKNVVFVHFGTLAHAPPAELTARFSKYVFWIPDQILDFNIFSPFFFQNRKQS